MCCQYPVSGSRDRTSCWLDSHLKPTDLATEQGLVPYEEIDLAGIINNVRYILAESVNKSPITSDSRTHVLPQEIVGDSRQ